MGENFGKNKGGKNNEWWAGIFQDEDEAVYIIISTQKDEVKKKEKCHKKISVRKKGNFESAINYIIKTAKEKNLSIPKILQ